MDEFVDGSEQDDDTTLIEVVMDDALREDKESAVTKAGISQGPRDWNMEYRLEASTLKSFNPVPLMNHIMMEVPGLRAIGGQLYTVVAELFSNAFEHGVLGLESSMKQSPDGFVEYYRQREKRVAALEEGFVRINMHHTGDGDSGKLTLTLEDSGDGFDYQQHDISIGNNYSGRGIPLIESICDSIEYHGKGNKVSVVIHWPLELET